MRYTLGAPLVANAKCVGNKWGGSCGAGLGGRGPPPLHNQFTAINSRRGGLGVAQRFVQGLVCGEGLFEDSPPIVETTECDGGAIVHAAVVERRSDPLKRYPK